MKLCMIVFTFILGDTIIKNRDKIFETIIKKSSKGKIKLAINYQDVEHAVYLLS